MPAPVVNGGGDRFWRWNSNFEGLVTLTFDPAIRHIVLQQSSTSTYIPNFIQIEETFCGRTDVRMDVRTDVRTGERTFFPSILLGRLSEVDLKTKQTKYTSVNNMYSEWLTWRRFCKRPDVFNSWNRLSIRCSNPWCALWQLCCLLWTEVHQRCFAF